MSTLHPLQQFAACPMHDLHVIMIERYSAMAKLEQGKLPEAETMGRTCVNNHAKYISANHLFTAGDYLMLANILKKAGKTADAITYYALGLNAFDTLAKTLNPLDFDAGRAIACEGLAEMDSRTGKSMQAIQLRGKVSGFRQIHSNCPPKITDDDAFFFSLWGHFPTPIDPFQRTAQ